MIDWREWTKNSHKDICRIMDYWGSQDPKYFDAITADIVFDIILDKILEIEQDNIFRELSKLREEMHKLELSAIKYGDNQ